MKVQKEAEIVMNAYDICRDQLTKLEQDHGIAIGVRETAEGFQWCFSDQSYANINRSGMLL